MLSPRAIARILDAATTLAISLFSCPPPSTPSSSPSTPLPLLSLSPLFLLHQPTRPCLHGPSFSYLFTHNPRGSLFADDLGCHLLSFFLLLSLSVFLPPALPPPSSLPSPPLDLVIGLGSSPSPCRRWPLLLSSLTTTPQPLSPLSSASSPPLLLWSLLSAAYLFLSFFVCQTPPSPISSLPHLLSFFSSAPLLTSPSTLATTIAAVVCSCLSSFSSFLYSTAAATADCRFCCRRRSHPSLPPSLFFSCCHYLHPLP